ncbi:TetR/AcrR family transcriptional regulator [Luteipulveratus flavus]|uniref:TetR/AcrR family transcriptional regulator n=1 Tax=Luteipulveratus flavus TaxID=3031728 RepID=A0ABT6C4N9_9MICO|nr:TetR/AcrR family transcriptional regulator [Luteipulveratus sp. YIM 133296]MDF8263661.1 TetR/AcrR family transcriptional regulator [Luteipulveratus sp. YIM 133296]
MGDLRTVSHRRAVTRQRLVDAALGVFAEQGFGRTTVEQVCDRAGFTRGAFYSNFSSLDELFLAMWEQRSADMVSGLHTAFEERMPDQVGSVREAVEFALAVIPVDEDWYRVSAEFTAHALRTPGMRWVMAERERGIQRALLPVIERLLAMNGQEVVNRDALGQALVAVHDGTLVQCLVEPDDEVVHARRVDLFVLVVEAHTKESR